MAGILNVPETVGVPEMVFPEKFNPAGKVEVPIVKTVEVPVGFAVKVYEKASPTFPVADSELEITGMEHCGASTTVIVAVSVALLPPFTQVIV